MDEKESGPSDLQWVERREKVVQQAIDDGDLGKLRELAALPGGFGSNEMRKRVWPILLGTERYFAHQDDDEERELPVHPEEEQVGKDTNRSFVSYPRGIPQESKMEMKADLHDLIVSVLRKYPGLSYFQGYHDIMSVLYLTYIPLPAKPSRSGPASRQDSRDEIKETTTQPHDDTEGVDMEKEALKSEDQRESATVEGKNTEEWRTLRQCAQVLSLCRVRDAMGTGMQPMMAYLRLLKRVLQAADPEIAKFSATISPVPTLPFFALSWILTLFSHDVDTLEPIQRMFDFLLSRNPISAIYLAVAIIVAKKPQMLKLVKAMGQEAMDDPSILHPLFARLPPLVADDPATTSASLGEKEVDTKQGNEYDDPNPYEPILLSTIFRITDDLLARYPYDGPLIRGQEILGEASSVNTFSREMDDDWTLRLAESQITDQVIKPGADMLDEEEEEEVPRPIRKPRIRVPRNKIGTVVAISVVLVGMGIAVYGARSGGPRSNWARWWSVVVRDWMSKSYTGVGSVRGALGYWTASGASFLRKLLDA